MKMKSVPVLFLEIVNPVAFFFCLCCGGGRQWLSLRTSAFTLSESLQVVGRKGVYFLGMSSDLLSLMTFVGVLRKSCRAARVTHPPAADWRQAGGQQPQHNWEVQSKPSVHHKKEKMTCSVVSVCPSLCHNAGKNSDSLYSL